jgi:hypothetical protein
MDPITGGLLLGGAGLLTNIFGGKSKMQTIDPYATAGAMNTNFDEIEAVVNALDADNLAADSVQAVALNPDVVRADKGLSQHTDGTLQVDVSDTNPGLELSDGGVRVKAYGLNQRTANGLEVGRAGDLLLSSAAATPDGWTDVSATYSDKFIRINATALSTGGADTLTGNTGDHTHFKCSDNPEFRDDKNVS